MKKLVVLLFSIFLLTGCYDYVELDEMKLVSSVIIDYKDDEYLVTLELLNASKDADEGSVFIDASGKSLEEAINNARSNVDADPYFGHMSALFITDDFAEAGIKPTFDFLARNVEIRKDFYIFLTDDADSLKEYESNAGESLGINVKKTYMRSIEKNGKYKTCNLREVFRKYLRNQNYVIGSVEVEDNKINLVDNFVFKDNKKGLEIEEDIALLINLMEGNTNSFLVDGNTSYEIHEYKMEIKAKKDKIIMKLSGSGRIKSAKDGAYTYEDVKKASKDVSEKLKTRIEDIVEYSKRIGIDILGFNNIYYQYYPRLVESDTWKTIDYQVEVDIGIGDKGMIMSTLKGEKNGK